MQLTEFTLYLSQFLAVVSVIPYLHGVYTKKITPNRISWAIITLVGMVNFLAIASSPDMELSSKLFAGVLSLNPALILIASFFRGEFIKVTNFEKIAASLAVVALIIWWFTRDISVLFALSVGILANALGILPTILFIRNNPDKDRPTAWSLFVLSSIFALLSLRAFDISGIILPVYMILSSSAILFFLLRYRIENNIPFREWL